MSPTASVIRRSPLFWYFALAYAASAIALAVIGWPHLDGGGGRPLVSLVMFPVIVIAAGTAGLLLTGVTGGKCGLEQLRARMTHWRLGRWWLVLLLPPLGILCVLSILRALISPSFAPQFLAFGLAAGILAGFFEEIGWTGFAFPRLAARFGPLGGALVLGVLWALWHLPVVDSMGAASPHGAAWPEFFASFAAVVVAIRVLIAWVYTNTGSVLGAQLLHASSTGWLVILSPSGVSPAQEALWYVAYAAVLWIVVALVVARDGARLTSTSPDSARRAGTRRGPIDASAAMG